MKKILVVDDNLMMRRLIRNVFRDDRLDITEARNGLEGLQLVKENSFDLVITDIVMPEMGGVALYETLRERWPGVKVLFITGHPVIEQDRSLLESGNVHWLQKPFSVGEFGKAVLSLLKKSSDITS